MTTTELAIAILVLLVTPGPTNTLLFVAGADRGWGRALRLIPAELAGYLAGVVPLMLLGTSVLARLPEADRVISILAAVWIALLAARLFQMPVMGELRPMVGARLVFLTTLMNPKALVFGLVLLPGPHAPYNLGLFVVQVMLVATGWAAAGAVLRQGDGNTLRLLRRAAAVWLAIVSAMLLLRGVGA